MNIKRAFYLLAALMLLPLSAFAQNPTATFEVDYDVFPSSAPQADVPNTAYISCNAGTPLDNHTEVVDNDNKFFLLEFPEAGPDGGDTDCTITADSIPGFTTNYSCGTTLNSMGCSASASGCDFSNVRGGIEDLGGFGECNVQMRADPVRFEVSKEWDIVGDGGLNINPEYSITLHCNSGLTDNSGAYFCSSGKFDYSCTWYFQGTANQSMWVEVTSDGQFAPPSCWAEEDIANSAVASDDNCGSRQIPIGTSSSCTITNTVFFEGIPTLSQYGLAIMALLMLGVGFVGFRRFI